MLFTSFAILIVVYLYKLIIDTKNSIVYILRHVHTYNQIKEMEKG